MAQESLGGSRLSCSHSKPFRLLVDSYADVQEVRQDGRGAKVITVNRKEEQGERGVGDRGDQGGVFNGWRVGRGGVDRVRLGGFGGRQDGEGGA